MDNRVSTYNAYKKLKLGNHVDVDGKFDFQCVDLMRDYARFAKYPMITTFGNAIGLWNQGLGPNYTRVYNSMDGYPKVGAIVFWKQGIYGHVAIAGRANVMWMEVLEQNGGRGSGDGQGNDAIRVRKDFYHNCLGWFMPNK